MNEENASINELSPSALIKSIWKGRFVIFLTGVFFAVISVAITMRMPNVYSSQIVLVPAPDETGGALGGLGSRFGDLANFAGISVGEDGVDKTVLAMEILLSRKFLVAFVKKHSLTVPLMSATGWDEKKGEWQIDPEIYDVKSMQWVRDVNPPRKKEPSDGEIYEEMLSRISVNQDKKTKIVKVKFSAFSPRFARDWVDLLVRDLNEFIKNDDVEEARKSITYLKKQIGRTQVADFRVALNSIIESQMKTIMLAEVREGYVFKVVDPPVVPEKKEFPRRLLIAVVSALLGGLLSSFVIFARFTFQR
jgi:LPS O-antigen subunit length determinant protein (WzzB/FepE family)